jgi:hypothetical protein
MNRLALLIAATFLYFVTTAQQLSLAGKWTVQLGSNTGKKMPVLLPGTLDDAGIGEPVRVDTGLTIATLAHLSRKVQYTGKAFYTRSFVIPSSWKSKKVILFLERVLWKSSVTINNKLLPSSSESLVGPHEHDVTNYLQHGKINSITICIDNSSIYPNINVEGDKYVAVESREMAHAYTNHTQIKWNGILGKLLLRAKPISHIKKASVYTNFTDKKITIQYQVKNVPVDSNISISAFVTHQLTGKKWPATIRQLSVTTNDFTVSIPYPKNAEYWSEFAPTLYQLTSILKSPNGNDTTTTSFGLRNLTTQNANLYINGNRLFIRSNLECIIFPLTGYPPTVEKEWLRLYQKAKSFGLNSFRFHSWCPPEAAFDAADKLGFYLHVELPHWNLKVGQDSVTFNFLTTEAHQILNQYGNHPSFLFFSMGNELEGDFEKLNNLVATLKATDNRHLYSTTTFTFQKEISGIPQQQDDYFVTQWTKKGWVRGQGVFNTQPPDFVTDYTKSAEGLSVPLISHEIGQYAVYPDLTEIEKYKGNLRAINFIAVKNDLQKKGLLSLAPSYIQASAKFASILYKEEIERALKTKEFDGFQLLQLQDFPGQGTALVGLLNAFWEPKGTITAKEFSRYCNAVTPLLRYEKAVYTNNELFRGTVEIANFRSVLKQAVIQWKATTENGHVLQSGSFSPRDIAVENGITIGEINFPFQTITSAKKITIQVTIAGTAYNNQWEFWVYPAQLPEVTTDVVVTSSSQEALTALNAGKKVLLCPQPDTLNGITGRFVPVFWSPVHFPNQPGTMGLLIKASNKALADFPSDNYSNWQWWDLTINSKAVKVANLPDKANIVRPIDNFVTNENLSTLFEATMGKGKLLFCSIDIVRNLENRPQARQLKYSLLKYMNSNHFQPSAAMKKEQLIAFIK